MPTGYTAELMEKGLPFRTFVLRCARAFGACVEQRDEAMSILPERRKVGDYYTKALRDAEKALAKLKGMSPKKQQDYGEERRAEAVAAAMQSRAKAQAENARLEKMAVQVRAWEPPSGEHKGLKDFMLQQIGTSRNDPSWTERYVSEAEEKTQEAYYVEAISKAVRDIAYFTEELGKEQKRVDGSNEWIDQLYKSLPK